MRNLFLFLLAFSQLSVGLYAQGNQTKYNPNNPIQDSYLDYSDESKPKIKILLNPATADSSDDSDKFSVRTFTVNGIRMPRGCYSPKKDLEFYCNIEIADNNLQAIPVQWQSITYSLTYPVQGNDTTITSKIIPRPASTAPITFDWDNITRSGTKKISLTIKPTQDIRARVLMKGANNEILAENGRDGNLFERGVDNKAILKIKSPDDVKSGTTYTLEVVTSPTELARKMIASRVNFVWQAKDFESVELSKDTQQKLSQLNLKNGGDIKIVTEPHAEVTVRVNKNNIAISKLDPADQSPIIPISDLEKATTELYNDLIIETQNPVYSKTFRFYRDPKIYLKDAISIDLVTLKEGEIKDKAKGEYVKLKYRLTRNTKPAIKFANAGDTFESLPSADETDCKSSDGCYVSYINTKTNDIIAEFAKTKKDDGNIEKGAVAFKIVDTNLKRDDPNAEISKFEISFVRPNETLVKNLKDIVTRRNKKGENQKDVKKDLIDTLFPAPEDKENVAKDGTDEKRVIETILDTTKGQNATEDTIKKVLRIAAIAGKVTAGAFGISLPIPTF